jgi:orotate phosphoribosyltransferase
MSIEMQEKLALSLFEIGAVRFGNFKLHSGKKSPIYLDLRVLASYPAVLRQAAAVYGATLQPLRFDLLAATPLAGLPIGTAVSLAMDIPLIYPRKTVKTYGTGNQIEGHWQVGQTAVVLDDLITSGDSLLETISLLKGSGLQIRDAVVLIDREQGGAQTLADQGYTLHAALTMRHLLAILESHEQISAKKRANVLAALNLA